MKFIRQDTHKKKKLAKVWRKPRGSDSKLRLRMQGRPIVSPGYGKDSDKKGKHPSGLDIVYVISKTDISKINPKTQGAMISAKVGMKRRIELIEELVSKKITILNLKNPAEKLQEFKKAIEDKKKLKKEEKKPKEEKKKSSIEDKVEEKISEEDKKKLEKKEIDKLLTKKQ